MNAVYTVSPNVFSQFQCYLRVYQTIPRRRQQWRDSWEFSERLANGPVSGDRPAPVGSPLWRHVPGQKEPSYMLLICLKTGTIAGNSPLGFLAAGRYKHIGGT